MSAFELITPNATHADKISALLDATIGPGRLVRMAERLRENNQPIPSLARIAISTSQPQTAPIGSIAYWPIVIGTIPALLLGPLVIADDWQGQGVGRALLAESLAAAKAQGHKWVLLVGDAPYYAAHGFQQAPDGLCYPMPVDKARVLICALAGDSEPIAESANSPANSPAHKPVPKSVHVRAAPANLEQSP